VKVVAGTLTHGSPRIEWVTGFMLLWDYEQSKGDQCLIAKRHFSVGPYIHKNRAELVLKMYSADVDGIFSTDHDVFTPPDTLERMVATMEETGAGVVAGDLVLGSDVPTTGFLRSKTDLDFVAGTAPVGETVGQVDIAATSCILIHRRVFDKISAFRDEPPLFGPGCWFMHWPVWDEKLGIYQTLGEDFSFSRRAVAVGEKIVVQYGLGLDHWKVGRMLPRPKKEG
jgi:hypothetical protein